MKTWKKLCIVALILLIITLAVKFSGISSYCSLENIQQHSDWIYALIKDYYPIAVLFFIVIYVTAIALSIPSTGPLGIAAGYFFGMWAGVAYCMIASLIGASISFYFLKKIGVHIREEHRDAGKLKSRFERFGHLYLLILHFSIMVPFLVINTMAVVAHVSWPTFLWVTAVGIIPAILLYVFAGNQLTTIHSIKDLFSWPIMCALLLLIAVVLIPIIVKRKENK